MKDFSETENLCAVDFETNPVPFFEKRNRKSVKWDGHPRLARPIIASFKNALSNEAFEVSREIVLPDADVLLFHNALFDIQVGINAGVWHDRDFPKLAFHCTATMAKLSDNSRSARLKDLAASIFNVSPTTYESAKNSEIDGFLDYAKADAEYTYKLYPILKMELTEKGLWDLYENIEKPFLLVNLECQRNGFGFDLLKSTLEVEIVKSRINELKETLADPNINWNSHTQVKRKIFGDYNLPVVYLKGKVSTSKRALKELVYDCRIATLLELKKNEALLRHIQALSKFVDEKTYRIHPFINPLGADTGRASSSCPNLQNIEKESVLRNFFRAQENYKLIVLDFSQIEPRVLAHFLGPCSFTEIFQSADDFYEVVGKRLSSSGPTGFTARAIVKQVILATFYGMGPQTLAGCIKVTKPEAAAILETFFRVFPEIAAFREEELRKARRNGFTVGLLGRRRYIQNLNDADAHTRFRAERQVLNSIIQGSAATIFKLKLVELRRKLPVEIRFIHHVHDEVILESPVSNAPTMLKTAKLILEQNPPWFSVPLEVKGGIGDTWSDAKT
ncbi:MAG: hypothetical protein K2X47_11715 [Bdellovibrionales bacterium]|nr:hypothetical protein [Bdellovibrionales bacterium]